jgi:carbon-monoxide dehydrogenase small subunit
MRKHFITIKVNGKEYGLYVDSTDRLIDVLRYRLGFKSLKEACSTGDCGLCTVLMDGRPILSCLTLAVQARNREIFTVEGLGDEKKLHPLQESFRKAFASQCGYCTPAMLLMGKYLLDRNSHPSEEEIKEAISGTLCRCTGYYSIIEAIRRASEVS